MTKQHDNKRAATRVAAVKRWWLAPIQVGIGTRLTLSFAAVAVLAIAGNLIVSGGASILHTVEIIQPQHPTARVPVQDRETIVAVEPERPAPPVALPSADGVQRLIERMLALLQSSGQGDPTETAERYRKLSQDLERSATAYATALGAAGQPVPAGLLPAVGAFRQQGTESITLDATRHELRAQYAGHFEQLNTRVKQALDRAWKIFGRVVTRQSLVQVSRSLDDLRVRYAKFIESDSIDPASFAALGSGEQSLTDALTRDKQGSTRSDGQKWYDECRDDLRAMSVARVALQRLEQDRTLAERRLLELSASILRTLTSLPGEHASGAAHTAHQVASGAMDGSRKPGTDHQLPSTRTDHQLPSAITDHQLHSAWTDHESSATGLEAADNPQVAPARSVTMRTYDLETPASDDSARYTLGWITVASLLVIIYLSVRTALSIIRPVTRLLNAAARIAAGDVAVRVPRGGIKELDTLARAFNNMSDQLAIAQGAARGQQNLLEAKVAERTAQLQDLAERDPLTRLANRRHFFALLNEAIHAARQRGGKVGVYFIDIDNFKNMNDSLGHGFGDRVLQSIAARLAAATEPFGFAARLGGDEFTVVYQSAESVEDIRAAGVSLVEAFTQPLSLEGREIVISVSVGTGVFPDHALDSEALLRAADAAMFQAKALGRNQLALFTPQLLDAATAKFDIEQGLRRAMERGEFELAFQPEVNLQSGRTELVEALLRWRQPDGRLVLPGEFLPVAEDSGLILQINDWVLRMAIETAARWHHGAWPDARVAINVSSRQLFDESFVERVRRLLEEYRLPPRCIEIELTETVLQTGSSTIEALRRLRAHGIAIALDDFGTGFSSLASLERLPLTRIKLDRSLIASIDTSARSAAIARAIIALCQGLGLAMTAEGIERPEQLARLLGYAALSAQGFLIAPPVSADELLPVLANLAATAQSLVRTSLAGVPEGELAEILPLLSVANKS